jgi:hypothetical protein
VEIQINVLPVLPDFWYRQEEFYGYWLTVAYSSIDRYEGGEEQFFSSTPEDDNGRIRRPLNPSKQYLILNIRGLNKFCKVDLDFSPSYCELQDGSFQWVGHDHALHTRDPETGYIQPNVAYHVFKYM